MESEQTTSPEKKPISTRTVAAYFAWSLLGILLLGGPLYCFSFMGHHISDFWLPTYLALLTTCYVLAFHEPPGRDRRLCIGLLVLVTIISPIVIVYIYLVNPEKKAVQVLDAGKVRVKLLTCYDASCCDVQGNNLSLVMEKPILGGICDLNQTLLFVQPAREGTLEIVNQGSAIKFKAPALVDREEIERIYSTDWNSATRSPTETIYVAPAYFTNGDLVRE